MNPQPLLPHADSSRRQLLGGPIDHPGVAPGLLGAAQAGTEPEVFCRVLGPLAVEVDGRAVDVGGRLPRRLIGGLLLADGAAVSDAMLIELVWDVDAPADEMNGLRVLVSRFRALLGSRGRHLVRRVGSGYHFRLSSESTDQGRLAALVAEGGRLLEQGEAGKAAQAFESGLLLWRGEPWFELGDGLMVSGPRARLVELREVAVEELQAARLELGDTTAAVAALSEEVIEAPYRERRWELLALGLYRSGQQVQALAELRRVRALMIDELGVEPGPALRALEQRMLAHDPSLLAPRTVATSHPTTGDASGVEVRPPKRPAIVRPLSSFVGRADQRVLLGRLLDEQRLVSVVGPAGVGKTRLALEHAADQNAEGTGEVWLARLADVRTEDAVASSVASAVGLIDIGGDAVDVTCRALADQSGLLVLDNCEHVLDTAGELVLSLLAACPGLRVLATSRAPLRVDGEQVLVLNPLPIFDTDGQDGPAIGLLTDRVRQHRAGWTPGPTELVAAREICAMLDGLPLAVELAAARERVFGLPQIAAHLRERLDLLDAAPKDTLNPHASLGAAIGWSIDQLDPTDRAFLLRLWPFEGGFSWRAVQWPDAGDRPVLAVLASLLDRSVISTDSVDGAVRYRMLETIRRYCRDRDADPAATQTAHASWVRDLVAEQTALLEGPLGESALALLRLELPNIYAALHHDLAYSPANALATASRLELAWVLLGKVADGVRLTRAALDACPSAGPAQRAAGLLALSFAHSHGGAAGEALRLADTALSLLEPDDPDTVALYLRALHFRGAAIMDLGDPVAAREALARLNHALQRLPGPAWMPALTSLGEGMIRIMEGRSAEAATVLEEARAEARGSGAMWVEGLASWILALGLLRRDADRPSTLAALALLGQALDVFQRQGNLCDVLAVLRHGSYVLARLELRDAAVMLYQAVHAHATRTGTDPHRYAHLAGQAVEEDMARLASGSDATDTPGAGAALDWTEMVGLFVQAATQVADAET